jgi:hypothetical protein
MTIVESLHNSPVNGEPLKFRVLSVSEEWWSAGC